MLGLLAMLLGCGDNSALIIVGVTGRPSDVTELKVTVTLDGKTTPMPVPITQSLDLFGFLVPPGPEGPVVILANGVNGSGCTVAQGETDSVLTGQDRVQLTLAMSALAMPVCN